MRSVTSFCFLFLVFFIQTADGAIIDKGYKQVAVVEDFYDIIYNVHVQTEGKEGKHAGQKRTYRAVSKRDYIDVRCFGGLCEVRLFHELD